jgi:hypothetical protein
MRRKQMSTEEKGREHYPTKPPATDDVIKQLTTNLTQVKDQPALLPRPLSEKAAAANAAHIDLRRFLAHR